MHKQIDELLQKRMDRKDFLKHVAMGVAIITGTAGIVKFFRGGDNQPNGNSAQTANLGYGASAYGGKPLANK
jgi:hypothetical protein